jgi:hypothetical protein
VKMRTLLAVAVALTTGYCQAETLIDTDFSQGAAGWVLNGFARLEMPNVAAPGGGQVLSLVRDANDQRAAVWTEISRQVPSFSFTADWRFRHASSACPADGATMAFAPVPASFLGGGGGALGLFGEGEDGPAERFTALDINTWYGQGLGSGDCNDPDAISETVAFHVVNPDTDNSRGGQDNPGEIGDGGAKLGQVALPAGMKLMNGGFYRFQWNVDQANRTMTVYITGLEDSNKQFQKVKVLEVKFPDQDPVKNLIGFEGRWGLTAATGGLNMRAEIARARIDSPMIDPL